MKRILCFALAAMSLVSCTQDATLTIKPDITAIALGPEGGSFNAIVYTNGRWKATCSDESVSFTPDTAEFTAPIHVEVGPNHEKFTKAIAISLKTEMDGNNRSSKIVITQACSPFLFVEGEDIKRVGTEGGAVRFTLNSNVPWAWQEEQDEYSVNPVTGGPNSTEVTVTVPPRTLPVERWRYLTFYLVDDPSVKIQVSVVQAGKEFVQ